MAASYHIDTSEYSLQKMKEDLLSRDLIPSRLPLKEGLEEKFQILDGEGIQTLGDLIRALKNKTKVGEFSSASGRVRVSLAESPEVDLDISTASGRAVLDYNGNPLSGHYEFVCKARKGRVSSPVDFEDEETFRRHGERYIARTFTKGSDAPQILLGTATGSVTLKD